MKSKFKDYLLYTLSTIGVVALFISATTQPPQTSTVPESHVWEMSKGAGVFMFNKITGEVRKYKPENLKYYSNGKLVEPDYGTYHLMTEKQ
ncbi:hypothetical protein N9T03_00725 [Bacteroidota bacterium]|nr:hypothetical protein [Bacteroidota bacterium]